MNILEKIRIGTKILGSTILKKKNIISVELSVTHRCNLNCNYCIPVPKYINQDSLPMQNEMSAQEITEVFSKLNSLNVERINISGGEPLVREDIGEIVESAVKNKFKVTLTSNGVLVPSHIDLLKKLHFLILSIDGEKNTHDSLRGEGTHKLAMESIGLARKNKIKVILSSVITSKTTVEDLSFLLELCGFYDIHCILQPVWNVVFLKSDRFDRYQRAQDSVPSFIHLQHLFKSLRNNPEKKRIVGGDRFIDFLLGTYKDWERGAARAEPCMAGRLFLYISPEGRMFPCTLRTQDLLVKEVQSCSLDEIRGLKTDLIKCRGCSCYSYRLLNKISRLDFAGILQPFRI